MNSSSQNNIVMQRESKKVRALREASGLTQLELAKRAGVDRTRVSLWESGYVRLSRTEKRRVRTVLLDAARERVITIQTAIEVSLEPGRLGEADRKFIGDGNDRDSDKPTRRAPMC